MRGASFLLLACTWAALSAAVHGVALAAPRTATAEAPLQGGADPESASWRIGRRTNAPWVKEPFTGGTRSLDDLGRKLCRAFGIASRDSLLALCITPDEFRDILWREFPSSRPATGLTWEDGWLSLGNRFSAGSRGAVQEWGGQRLTFVRWEGRRSVVRYRNFTLLNGLVLVARTPEGESVRIPWVRAVAERKGVFKIYSVTD